MGEDSSDEEFEFARPGGGQGIRGKGLSKGGLAAEFSMYAAPEAQILLNRGGKKQPKKSIQPSLEEVMVSQLHFESDSDSDSHLEHTRDREGSYSSLVQLPYTPIRDVFAGMPILYQPVATDAESNAAVRPRVYRSEELSLPRDLWLLVATGALLALSVYEVSKRLSAHHWSLLVGYSIIIFATLSKVPYIRRIEDSQTAEGISMLKQYNDILSITFNILFNVIRRNAFVTWGEKLFLLMQDMYIMHLIWGFQKMSPARRTGYCIAYVAAIGVLGFGIQAVDTLQSWVIPLVKLLISKPGLCMQIYHNEKNRHTGPLSIVTQAMVTMVKFGRLVTGVTELSDPLLILNVILGWLLNFIVLTQIMFYQKNTAIFLTAIKKQRKKAKRRSKHEDEY